MLRIHEFQERPAQVLGCSTDTHYAGDPTLVPKTA